ncbi:MAG: PAQR family membrane homeostasis protein TrhA [Desulfovibrionales bacterium]
MEKKPRYSPREEVANSLTHGLGILLGIIGLVVLTYFSGSRGTMVHMVSCSIFGGTLILLYTASTLYHSISAPHLKRILRVVDHSAIFLLIAGTYTPFTLVSLRGPWGWSLFGTIWGLALVGLILQFTIRKRHPWIILSLYVIMGWAVVVAAKPLFSAVQTGGLLLLLAGGLAYTLGIVFYLLRSMPYHHAVWHLFVLAGSGFHFFAVLFYVLPEA